MATFGQLISRCLIRLRQQGGLDVNIYSQPVIAEMLQHKFDTLFDRRFWRRHTTTSTWTLDGTTGQVTADISAQIKEFNDIKGIWPTDYRNPLPILDESVNPDFINMLVFGSSADPTKVFKLYPESTTGNVRVKYRTRPDPFTENDTVPFDDQILIVGTCFDFLSDEAADATNVRKFLQMYQDRLDRLEKLEDNHTRSYYSQSSATVNDWHDR
jgi:hypothetical protein